MSWLERSGIKKDKDGKPKSSLSLNDEDSIHDIKNDRATPVIDEERGIPSVNQRSFKSRAMPVSLAAVAFAIAGLIWLIPSPKPPDAKYPNDPKATKNERFDENMPSAILAPARPPEPPMSPSSASQASAPPINIIPALDGMAAPQPGQTASGIKTLTPFQYRQVSKQIIVAGSSAGAGVPNYGGPTPVAVPAAGARGAPVLPANRDNDGGLTSKSGGANGSGSLAESLTPTKLVAVSASRLEDRTFTIARGAMLDCNLDTAISSAVPGMTKCTTTQNIYGDDGKVVMLDRGTELTGQYQGALQQGQSRLFILWTRAKTPNGVIIDLASPGTDSLGRSGVDGYIDSHFWERFGSALLLSVVDDLATMAGRSQSGNNTVVLPSTTGASKNAASIAVENSIRIPPTLNKNQGEHVSVFVARDLNFRTVYALRLPKAAIDDRYANAAKAANDDRYMVKAANE